MSPQLLNNFGVVILAAGRGTRLGCTDMPKVMKEIGGRPIVDYLVETLENIGFSPDKICVVVGFKGEKVRDFFGRRVTCVDQGELRGTAHAAFVGMQTLPKEVKNVLVMNGDDGAFYQSKTLADLMQSHLVNNDLLTLLSAEADPSFGGGRIVRHTDGQVEVIEKEYLTEEQKQIREISTNTFCFERTWYEKIFPVMPQLRKLGEWGLPTALAMARGEGVKYSVIKLDDSREWFGINSPAELELADKLKRNNHHL